MRSLGFDVTNDIFAENAWYFRNALVRANYTNLQAGIYETTEYLEIFLRNLLLNEHNELKSKYLHIHSLQKVDIGSQKVDIKEEKVDIGSQKVDIEHILKQSSESFSSKSVSHIKQLYTDFGLAYIWGRTDVMKSIELKTSGASKLIAKLVNADIIEPVTGHGKGRYKFKEIK